MFCVIKKKVLLFAILTVFAVVGISVFFALKFTSVPNVLPVIVIDAGHGGKDGGAVGDSVTESELNLQYALNLQKICEQFGYKVVLTRKDMNGLYSPFASNKKRSEMEKRQEIIKKAKPDLVVSIHMNSFSSSSVRGSQVFYANGSESGKELATSVQETLHQYIVYAKATAKVGDYYILNCVDVPSILVECGFISNAEEEALLQDERYRQKFCYNVFCGILQYFRMSN